MRWATARGANQNKQIWGLGRARIAGLQRSHVDTTHTHTHGSLAPRRRGRRGMTLAAVCLGLVRTALFDLVRLGECSIVGYNPTRKARPDPMWLPCRAPRHLFATRTNVRLTACLVLLCLCLFALLSQS